MSAGLRIGSLCTGYGGLDMAVQHVLGGELAWVADNDPGAARILSHHHPDVPNLGDITTAVWERVEPVDVLAGGYPCQPFSFAGQRKGTEDERHIWPHIATALGVLRPRYAVFENVAGHLSLGFDTVLADLARLGFDAEWICLEASAIGAPHRRRRLFILAWPADPQSPRRQRQGASRRPGQRPAPAADADGLGGHRHRTGQQPPQRHPPGTGTAAAHTARLGTGEPPDQTLTLAGSRTPRPEPGRGSRRAATHPQGHGRHQGRAEPAGLEGRPDPALGGGPDWGPYGPAVERWETILGRPAPQPTDPLGRLNHPFVEWLMGLPPGHVTDVPDLTRTAQLKALGNGVVPAQAAHALTLLLAATETTGGDGLSEVPSCLP